MVNVILMISRPRTGTSYAGELLSKSGLFDYRGELFNSQQPFNLKPSEFEAIFGVAMNTMAPREQATLVRDNALKVLNFIADQAEDSKLTPVVKVFSNHLSNTVLETLLRAPQVACFALDRAILPSYVSLLKASKSNHWDTHDTTNQEVEFNGSAFDGWFRESTVWYEHVQRTLRDASRVCPLITYESLSGVGHQQALEVLYSAVKQVMPTVGALKVQIESTRHVKQDTAQNYEATVTNYRHMMRAPGIYAARKGREHLWGIVEQALASD